MVNLNSLIRNVTTRPYDLSGNNPFIYKEQKELFRSNKEALNHIKSSQSNPLKIVLMGEVKAGKSTFLNAMVGEAVSNVGVTETTAIILEISYSDKKQAIIYYTNGELEKIKIEKLNDILQEKQEAGNTEFYSEIERVTLTYPLTKLQDLTIVDTPGIGTITTNNQETTEAYIMKSDVVIWLMNANHVGQASILKKILEVRKQGKPIILILNRMDQLKESQRERVFDYVEDEYDLYVEKVLPLSAEEAFQGIVKNDNDRYKHSGLTEILNYLENNIERSSENLKKQVLYESIISILNEEIITHIAMRENIKIINNTIEMREAETNNAINRINQLIDKKINHWIDNQFLKEEENELLTLASMENNDLVGNKLKNYHSGEYINDTIENMLNELNEEIIQERMLSLKQIDDTVIKEVERIQIEFQEYTDAHQLLDVKEEDSNSTDKIISGAKDGAIIGGTAGVAFATYVSLIGPAAAYITVGSALSAFFTPILLTSVVAGAGYRLLTGGRKDKNLQPQIITSFENIRIEIKEKLKSVIKKIKQDNKNVFNTLNKEAYEKIMSGSSISELQRIDTQIEKHISTLENDLTDLRREVNKLSQS